MTATFPRHAHDTVPGQRQQHPLAVIFRRAIAAVRRRGAVPVSPAGAAATTLLASVPLSADMPTGAFPALDAKVDAILRRPVNGRSLGTQPRRTPPRQPVYGERPVADVIAAENAARAAGRCKPPTRELLGQVLAGLRAL